jgi:glycosyltransferase involved in cell wall biosynthesis
VSREAVPVTFIVTGYNQSDLIDAAMQGALVQDYPRLQIILADDCSTDDTYDRMQSAAAAYRGSHQVLVNRPDRNKGTLGNIYDAARHATGELIVLAGGDDISYPHRTAVLVEHWLASKPDALFSGYDIIDEEGRILERDYKPDSSGLWLRDYFPGQVIEPLHGASSACHKSVFARYRAPERRIRSEDAFWTLMLALDGGRTEYVDRSLIQYRKHAGAITNEVPPAPDRAAIAARERVQMSFASSQAGLLELFAEQLQRKDVPLTVKRKLADDLRMFRLRAQWDVAGWRERLGALPAARRRSQLNWLMPRIAGERAFLTAKLAAAKLKRR